MKNKRNFLKKIPRSRMTIWLLLIMVGIRVVFQQNNDEDFIPRVCGGDQCFMVELARTPAERQKWLMYRESMEENSGMLFVFETSDIYGFWMKNTLIPLDMLRIDEQLNIVKVLTAEPCKTDPCSTYNPWATAKYVLEINAWMAAKYGITEWMKMRLVNIQ